MKLMTALACFLLLAPAPAEPPPDDLGPVEISGSAGSLLVWRDARPMLLTSGKPDDHDAHVVAAVSTLGRGRLAAFGHESFLNAEDANARALVTAAARWAGRGGPIGVDERFGAMADHLRKSGYPVATLDEDWLGSLDEVAVAVIAPRRIAAPDLGQIRRYLGAGGGLVTGSPGWGWQQLNPDKSLRDDSPLNSLFHAAGIAWVDEAVGGGPFQAHTEPSPLLHIERALDAIEGHRSGRRPLGVEDLRQAAATVTRAASGLPTRERRLLPRIDRLLRSAATAVPTPQSPLGPDHPLERAALRYQLGRMLAMPAQQVPAHPAAATFPGSVPAEAVRVKRSLTIDVDEPGWKSTGLYAAPGEVIRLTLPAEPPQGLAVQIGCHTDRNWRLPRWTRVPEITLRRDIGRGGTSIANPFGGPVYIIVAERSATSVQVEVEGAVEAPMFVLGQTSLREWRQTIRHHPAPWAELVGEDLILSLPSRAVRELEDPQQLMQWWDRVVQVQGELAPRPNGVVRPERIVTDQQIVAGYMHAGYPIMTWLDVVEEFVDHERLSTRGNWGIFHEIGHNHQWPEWTFEGTGEVTNNIFTVYTYERLVPEGERHPALRPEHRARQTARLSGPDGFKEDPFLALYMYLHLVEDFGWQPFKAFFAEFETLPRDQQPRNDQEERDRWLTRMSHHTGHNLKPLFSRWGVQTSQAAKDEVADLPRYEPAIEAPATPGGELMQENGSR